MKNFCGHTTAQQHEDHKKYQRACRVYGLSFLVVLGLGFPGGLGVEGFGQFRGVKV